MKRLPEKFLCSNCNALPKSIFYNFPPLQLGEVDKDKSCFLMKRGEVIFHEGNIPHGIYCIRKGKIKIFRIGSEGKDQIVKFAKTPVILLAIVPF